MGKIKDILIVLNGKLESKTFLKTLSKHYDFIIAADGGANKCLQAGFLPHLVIGDLDTITKKNKTLLKNNLLEIKRQDNTDFEKALEYIKTLNINEVDIALASGGREDFTISNFLTAFNFIKYFKIKFISQKEILYILNCGAKITCQKGVKVSLIATKQIKNITTKNLKFPLTNESLNYGQRGLSNIALKNNFEVSFKKGHLIISVQK